MCREGSSIKEYTKDISPAKIGEFEDLVDVLKLFVRQLLTSLSAAPFKNNATCLFSRDSSVMYSYIYRYNRLWKKNLFIFVDQSASQAYPKHLDKQEGER